MKQTNIQELDILSKYLSEDELKDIAKSAAYDLFKNYIAPDNKHRKDNINYFATQGAMMAMGSELDSIKSELQDLFNSKVKGCIRELSLYNLTGSKAYPLDNMISEAISVHKDEVKLRVNEIISDAYLMPESKWSDELYSKIYDMVGDHIAYEVNDALKNKYTSK